MNELLFYIGTQENSKNATFVADDMKCRLLDIDVLLSPEGKALLERNEKKALAKHYLNMCKGCLVSSDWMEAPKDIRDMLAHAILFNKKLTFIDAQEKESVISVDKLDNSDDELVADVKDVDKNVKDIVTDVKVVNKEVTEMTDQDGDQEEQPESVAVDPEEANMNILDSSVKKAGRKPKEFDIERAVELREQGYTVGEVARELGVGKTTAYTKLKEYEEEWGPIV